MNNKKLSYQDIVKVKVLTLENQVNDYLANGWVLISTYISDCGYPRFTMQTLHYCIGCPKGVNFEKDYSEDFSYYVK